jgi:small subunit ribosomal protein S8
VKLKYTDDNSPVIRNLKRVSSPGLRQYVSCDEIPRVLGGLGIAILSTSRGIMTGASARKAKVGGELLATIW